MKKNKKGFTLVELLVVVLIIGVLAAIALPMYQKAVLKSRFAALMPIGKSMADSNEAYFLEHGQYASNPQDLPVQGQVEYPTGTEVELAPGLEYAYVLASNDLARNNYIVYQKHSNKFADNIHCEALEDDEQANGVCTSFGGQPINGSLTDGYKTYVLSGTYGETDKLPTSMNKLAQTICANVSKENCSIDEETQTIISYTCEEKNQFGQTFFECDGTIYDSEGNRKGRTMLKCANGTTADENRKHCSEIDRTGYQWENRTTWDAANKQTDIGRVCAELSDGKCVAINGNIQIRNPDGSYSDSRYLCAASAVQDDGTCSAYTVLKGSEVGAYGVQERYNTKGKLEWNVRCTHRNPDGTCTSIADGVIVTYNANGVTETGRIRARCTTDHWSDTDPCTGYSLTYSGNASGPSTCPANRLNFNTFECAPES